MTRRRQQAAQFARSSRAPSLGERDPRWDRSAREGASAQDYGDGLTLDRQSRLTITKAKRVPLPDDAPDWARDLVRRLTDAGLMEK